MKNENQLDESISKIWENAIYDGIVDLEMYKNSEFKILWILKEANNGGTGLRGWNQREFHKNVSGYPNWRRTYKKIIQVSYGILNSIENYNDVPKVENDSTIKSKYILDNLAIINIKKNGGGSVSYQKIINQNYATHKEFLKTQIDLINPDIVVNASHVGSLFIDYCGNNFKSIEKFRYGFANGKLVIDAYHPNARYGEAKYYRNIMEAFLNWKNREITKI